MKKDSIKTLITVILMIFTTLVLANILTSKEPFIVTYIENVPQNQQITTASTTDETIPIETDIETANTLDTETEYLDSSASEVFSGINTYNNGEFSFKYLGSWSLKDSAESSEVDFLINGRNAMFSIVKEEIPEKFTLKDYLDSTKKTIENKENNRIIEIADVSHNGIEGSTIVYEITDEEKETTSIVNEFCTIHKNYIYVFTYYTDSSKYTNYLNEYNNLLDTLTFTQQ